MTKKPSLELRLQVLAAVDYAPGNTIRERIKAVAERSFVDPITSLTHQFTWRTISTWLYRFKKEGVTTLEPKVRSDKNSRRKVQPNELAEAIHEILPTLSVNKVGRVPKSVLYRLMIERGLFLRSQLSPTSFYRMVREHQLLDGENAKKLRLSFAMQYANELWQADTMHGPAIQLPDGSWKKTFFIAFIDDASRVITHGQFFWRDNTENMIEAFRTALFKRGKPERLYFDNGANYTSKEILQACLRLNIHLSHAPVRDGAAKGKIERFFRGFRDRFLVQHTKFESLDQLNRLTHQWIEQEYNQQPHSAIHMRPVDRFNLDMGRIHYLTDDQYTAEVFFVEETRKVSKTNVFSINNQRFECPVDLRDQKVQVRFDRTRRDRFVIYFNEQRMGEALPVNLYQNAKMKRLAPITPEGTA